jgi:hypothetical protein
VRGKNNRQGLHSHQCMNPGSLSAMMIGCCDWFLAYLPNTGVLQFENRVEAALHLDDVRPDSILTIAFKNCNVEENTTSLL